MSAQAAASCQKSLFPEAQERTRRSLPGGRSRTAEDRLHGPRLEPPGRRGGEGTPREPLGPMALAGREGHLQGADARLGAHTHPKAAAPFSSGESHPRLGVPPRLQPWERSKASAQRQACLSGVGPPSQRRPPRAGPRLTPQGRGTRSTTGTFAFSFPVLFRFFSLNLRKQVLRRQHSGVGLPRPEGHARIPAEGAAGGAGGERVCWWWDRQTAVRVGVLGWFSRSVLHNQPAKSTSSTSDRLMKAWF